jgi:hypothetical protein
MTIEIVPANKDAIEAMLKDGNGNARRHTYDRYSEIESAAINAERELETFGVAKARRQGARYTSQSGGYLPNAYRYVAEQTEVLIERRSSAWYLVSAYRVPLYPKSTGRTQLYVTRAQADEATRRLLSTVEIVRDLQVAQYA